METRLKNRDSSDSWRMTLHWTKKNVEGCELSTIFK